MFKSRKLLALDKMSEDWLHSKYTSRLMVISWLVSVNFVFNKKQYDSIAQIEILLFNAMFSNK